MIKHSDLNRIQKTIKSSPFVVAVIAGLILASSGCYYDIEEELYAGGSPCDTANVTFAAVVNPILANNCQSCHNSGIASGNVRLDSYAEIKKYVDNGKLLSAIKQEGTLAKAMPPPPSAPLGDCQINQIEVWINNGAPNN